MASAIAIPLSILASYLLGSVNFGIIVASARGIDIRAEGSGNPGMSNVLRVLGKPAAAAVLIGDGLKGAAAAGLGVAVADSELGYVALFAAVIGHSFPIWHGGRGGKSVATAIGGFMFLAPSVGIVLAAIWIGTVVVWKRASVASLAAMLIVVPALWLSDRTVPELFWAALIALFVINRHADNIRRLFTSSEQKVTG